MEIVGIRFDESHGINYPDYICAKCKRPLIGRRGGDHEDGCASKEAIAILGPETIEEIKNAASKRGDDFLFLGLSLNIIRRFLPEKV